MWDFNRGGRWILLKKITADYNAENNRLWGTHLELMDLSLREYQKDL